MLEGKGQIFSASPPCTAQPCELEAISYHTSLEEPINLCFGTNSGFHVARFDRSRNEMTNSPSEPVTFLYTYDPGYSEQQACITRGGGRF